MNYNQVSTTVKLRGREVKVHALCTGTVAVKRNFRKKNGIGELAKINILLDSHYTEYMPIWVWVIEHPDGLMIVDTGEIDELCISPQNNLSSDPRWKCRKPSTE
jgi:N-acyl homoserine lactone hydrolase